jgi:hypothetical protein
VKQEREQLAIIGCAGVPARYGGFETLAHHLVRELRRDYRITVYCSGPMYRAEERRRRYRGARLLYLPFRANGVQSIVYDIVSILHALWYACSSWACRAVSCCRSYGCSRIKRSL